MTTKSVHAISAQTRLNSTIFLVLTEFGYNFSNFKFRYGVCNEDI